MVSQSTSESLLYHIWKAWTDIGICISIKLPFWYSLSCFRDKWTLLIFHLSKSLISSNCSGFQRQHFCSNSHVITGVWLDAFFRHTSLHNSSILEFKCIFVVRVSELKCSFKYAEEWSFSL